MQTVPFIHIMVMKSSRQYGRIFAQSFLILAGFFMVLLILFLNLG